MRADLVVVGAGPAGVATASPRRAPASTWCWSTRPASPATSAAATASPPAPSACSSSWACDPATLPVLAGRRRRVGALTVGSGRRVPAPAGPGPLRRRRAAAWTSTRRWSTWPGRPASRCTTATGCAGRPARPTTSALDVDGLGAVEAPYVVGADGMWSPLRKLLGLATPGLPGRVARLPPVLPPTSPARPAERLWVWFEPDLLPGYAWSFPLPGRAGQRGLRRPPAATAGASRT